MNDVLSGIRVVEVASWTLGPSSGVILAEWGADVIKIEDPERGDPQRGLISSGILPRAAPISCTRSPTVANARSGSTSPARAAANCSTGWSRPRTCLSPTTCPTCAAARHRSRADPRAQPNVVYVRGSGNGQAGPEANRGEFDSATYWPRRDRLRPRRARLHLATRVRPGFGDLMGGLALAGGIAAALLNASAPPFHLKSMSRCWDWGFGTWGRTLLRPGC